MLQGAEQDECLLGAVFDIGRIGDILQKRQRLFVSLAPPQVLHS